MAGCTHTLRSGNACNVSRVGSNGLCIAHKGIFATGHATPPVPVVSKRPTTINRPTQAKEDPISPVGYEEPAAPTWIAPTRNTVPPPPKGPTTTNFTAEELTATAADFIAMRKNAKGTAAPGIAPTKEEVDRDKLIVQHQGQALKQLELKEKLADHGQTIDESGRVVPMTQEEKVEVAETKDEEPDESAMKKEKEFTDMVDLLAVGHDCVFLPLVEQVAKAGVAPENVHRLDGWADSTASNEAIKMSFRKTCETDAKHIIEQARPIYIYATFMALSLRKHFSRDIEAEEAKARSILLDD